MKTWVRIQRILCKYTLFILYLVAIGAHTPFQRHVYRQTDNVTGYIICTL